MSANGTFAKTFFLWLLLVAGGAFGWSQVTVDPVGTVSIPGWIFIPLLVAIGFALACIFAPRTAPFTAPLYAIAEGVVLGAISRVYEEQWSGIVLQAVLATLAVFVVCLALYVSGAVKVTNKFIFVVIAATAGIFLMYLAVVPALDLRRRPHLLERAQPTRHRDQRRHLLRRRAQPLRRLRDDPAHGRRGRAEEDGVVRRVRHHHHDRLALPRGPPPPLQAPQLALHDSGRPLGMPDHWTFCPGDGGCRSNER